MANEHQIPDKLREQFFRESSERLQEVESGLLAIEQDQDLMDQVRLIFRGFHGLKGIAGHVEAREIIELTKAGETLLAQVRDDGILFNKDWIDVLLRCHDELRVLIETLQTGQALSTVWQEVLNELTSIIRANSPPTSPDPDTSEDASLFMETAEAQIGGLEIYLRKWKPGILDRRMLTAVRRKLNLFSKSALKAGRADIVKSVNRSLDALDANENKEWTQEEINSFTAISKELRTLIKPGANRAHQEVVDRYRADLDAAFPAARRLEINPEYVEMMEALVSDFAIYSLQVRKELERMKPLMKSRAHLWLDGMSSDLERFAHAFAESCRRLHLVALSTIFDRFPRLVRDVAKRKGKSVQLQISGGEIELDKSQVAKLAEPLEHLIRNAVDHGLEPADERKAQGKNEKGVLDVRANAAKESVTIEIEDDGTGIDFDAIRRKAAELKLIGRDKAKSIPAEELMQFVFLTGLSTKDVPDTISGRGVGMDIVRQAMRELGGQLEVDSKPAKGTLFRLIIPLNQDI